MMVVMCYAPSSVLATISFMNGKGFSVPAGNRLKESCRHFDQNALVFIRTKVATGQEHILFTAALDFWCHRNTHLWVSPEVAE